MTAPLPPSARAAIFAEVRGWIRDVGFPIVVSFLLLWSYLIEIPRRLDALTDAAKAVGGKVERIEGALWRLLEREERRK